MTDKRTLQDPERQRLVQQQIMMNYQVQPSQVKKKKKSQLTACRRKKDQFGNENLVIAVIPRATGKWKILHL